MLESIVRSSLAQIGLLNAEITGLERELTDTLAKHPGVASTVEPSQFMSIRYGERLAEIGAVPSIGAPSETTTITLWLNR